MYGFVGCNLYCQCVVTVKRPQNQFSHFFIVEKSQVVYSKYILHLSPYQHTHHQHSNRLSVFIRSQKTIFCKLKKCCRKNNISTTLIIFYNLILLPHVHNNFYDSTQHIHNSTLGNKIPPHHIFSFLSFFFFPFSTTHNIHHHNPTHVATLSLQS